MKPYSCNFKVWHSIRMEISFEIKLHRDIFLVIFPSSFELLNLFWLVMEFQKPSFYTALVFNSLCSQKICFSGNQHFYVIGNIIRNISMLQFARGTGTWKISLSNLLWVKDCDAKMPGGLDVLKGSESMGLCSRSYCSPEWVELITLLAAMATFPFALESQTKPFFSLGHSH